MEKTKAERENNQEKKKWTSTKPHVGLSLITSLGVLIVKIKEKYPNNTISLNVLLRFKNCHTKKKGSKNLMRNSLLAHITMSVWMPAGHSAKKNLRSIYSRKVDWLPSSSHNSYILYFCCTTPKLRHHPNDAFQKKTMAGTF